MRMVNQPAMRIWLSALASKRCATLEVQVRRRKTESIKIGLRPCYGMLTTIGFELYWGVQIQPALQQQELPCSRWRRWSWLRPCWRICMRASYAAALQTSTSARGSKALYCSAPVESLLEICCPCCMTCTYDMDELQGLCCRCCLKGCHGLVMCLLCHMMADTRASSSRMKPASALQG